MDLDQIGEFIDWYVERFSEDELTNVRPTLVVLVALGNDESVERMARWLRLGGINISALTFQAFADGARTLMARGWTGAGTDPGRSAAASVRRAQSDARSVALRADDDELFAAGMALFVDCFEGTPYLTSSTKKGLGFRLPEGPETSSRQTYARVNVDPQTRGAISLVITERACGAVEGEFAALQTALSQLRISQTPSTAQDWRQFRVTSLDQLARARQHFITFFDAALATWRPSAAAGESSADTSREG